MSAVVEPAPMRSAGRSRRAGPGVARRALGLAGTVLVWAVLLVLLTVLALLVVIPRVMGWVPLTILTGSMEPTYPTGSQVVVQRVDSDERFDALQRGDAITFMPKPDDPTLVTHRIVRVTTTADGTRTFVTRGDNNDVDDPWRVGRKQVRGKVMYHVPYGGYVANRMTSGEKSSTATVLAGLLLAYAAVQAVLTVRGRRRARHAGAVDRGRRTTDHVPAHGRRGGS